jgi:CRP-like cAMP-binding protein
VRAESEHYVSELVSLTRPKSLHRLLASGVSLVEGNRLLAVLPPAHFQLLAPHLHKERFEPGQVLQEVGQPITRAYFLESGLLSLLAVLPDGNRIDAALIGREGAIGLMAGLVPRKAFTRAVVQVGAVALHMSIPRLAEVAARSNPIRDMIVGYYDWLLQEAQTRAACNSVHHVSQRLCGWLLQACQRSGDSRLPVTQRWLADALGVQRTTVTMISRTLQDKEIITVRRGKIQILNVKALEPEACRCWRKSGA